MGYACKLGNIGEGVTTDYKAYKLYAVGATISDNVHIKVGECVGVESSYGFIAYYKNRSTTLTTNPQINTDKNCIIIQSGDFMWLGGHNYGGAFLCLKEADYKFYNNSIAARVAFIVPNRIV